MNNFLNNFSQIFDTITGSVSEAPPMTIDQLHNAFVHAASEGRTDILEELVKVPGLNPAVDDNKAVILASFYGQLPAVQFLSKVPGVNVGAQDNLALILASNEGRVSVVEYLLGLPNVDPGARNNAAIIYAAAGGHLPVVKVLASDPRVNPADVDNKALRMAIKMNKPEVAAYLRSLPAVQRHVNLMSLDGEPIMLPRLSPSRPKLSDSLVFPPRRVSGPIIIPQIAAPRSPTLSCSASSRARRPTRRRSKRAWRRRRRRAKGNRRSSRRWRNRRAARRRSTAAAALEALVAPIKDEPKRVAGVALAEPHAVIALDAIARFLGAAGAEALADAPALGAGDLAREKRASIVAIVCRP